MRKGRKKKNGREMRRAAVSVRCKVRPIDRGAPRFRLIGKPACAATSLSPARLRQYRQPVPFSCLNASCLSPRLQLLLGWVDRLALLALLACASLPIPASPSHALPKMASRRFFSPPSRLISSHHLSPFIYGCPCFQHPPSLAECFHHPIFTHRQLHHIIA